jgi:alkaline phosphatase
VNENIDSRREPAGTGSVIFIHPDGTSYAHWAALRILDKGPDGLTNWDRLSNLGLYRGHLANSAVSSSNGGATAHAFGVKARFEDYGIHPERPIQALSGADCSILIEAKRAGKLTGLINSGHIAEPGSGVFAANSARRSDTDTITLQIVNSGVDIILSGGEKLLLPKGVKGRFGVEGIRGDGRNLIEEARQLGYTVVYTRDELMALDDNVEKILGVFAPNHTFHDMTEEQLRAAGLPLYVESAPTIGEMLEKSLAILSARGENFLLVVEEEGTDNFANDNNARGEFEALRRADAALGVALRHIESHPETMLITAADSDAGGLEIVPVPDDGSADAPLPSNDKNGAPLDGVDGTGTPPFVSAPDRAGIQHRFAVAWSGFGDVGGGIVARAHGLNADRLPLHVDNTDIYRMMHLTLFGRWLP